MLWVRFKGDERGNEEGITGFKEGETGHQLVVLITGNQRAKIPPETAAGCSGEEDDGDVTDDVCPRGPLGRERGARGLAYCCTAWLWPVIFFVLLFFSFLF